MAPKRKGTSLSGATYQVFLSFRGPDTRLGFADVLYHALTDAGIRVFRDDEEIRKGEDIGDEILMAIGESRIFVPIFSSGYASSKWCLIELSKMSESKEASPDSNKKILPIFYDVDADDVKLKTELYADPLLKHREKFSPDTVNQWEEALRKAGKIKGYAAKNRGHGEFAKFFVREVSMKLKVKHKFVTDYLVQRDEPAEALMRLLDMGTADVRFVGIHGMGGIGKTTLAKIAFNKLCDRFEHCSFLTDVRESCRRKGIEQLQKQLLGDLGFTSGDIMHVDDGIRRMRELFPHKKVLIVLDDVDDRNQIQSLAGDAGWFDQGSRVIITTRDQQVLGRGVQTLEVDAMKPEEALRLFSMHAFDYESPPIEHLSLSEDAVESTGRLPLALEVIGSHLRDIPHRKWAKTIERLKKVPHEEVQKKLMISYEALDPGTKQIFLDIACFFIGHEKKNPMYMWEACKFDAKMGLKKLIHKSLVKIDGVEVEYRPRTLKVKILGMHDQLRDLGRDIAKCSRMWMYEDAAKLLDEEEGKVNFEMLRFRNDESKAWDWVFHYWESEEFDIVTGNELSELGKLRYLQCIGSNFSGILPNLRWLSWNHCPKKFMGTGLSFKKLVILDLSHSYITEDWIGWSEIGVGNKLKVLDLTNCRVLRKTPDFSKYSSLERLILEDCIELVEIDPSIGKLKGLKFLNVNGCRSLKGLPEELCSLHYLEVILGFKAHRYDYLELFEEDYPKVGFSNLPELIGDLKSLLILVFHGNKITRLPESIIRLSRLRHISLRGIVELTPGVGLLENLEIMELISCECMEKFPDSIGDMKSLLELKISQSRITEIPETIGNLEQIRVISMSGSEIHKLPTSIGKLKRLEKLIVDSCNSLREIPSTIKGCTSLRVLNLAYCESMKELPDSIWDLNLLTELDLPFSGITELPESIGNLNELRLLNIEGCKISKLPASIGMLKKIEVLNAPNCLLTEIPSTIHGCTGLRELNLSHCESLKELPDSVGDLRSLHKLDLSYSGITKLSETIGNLKELRELSVVDCCLLEEIPSTIEGCTQLRELDLRGCEDIKELPVSECFLRSLRELHLPRNLEKVFGKTQVSSDSDWGEVSWDSD